MNSQALTLVFSLPLLLAGSVASAEPPAPTVRTVAEYTNRDETALLHHPLSIPALQVWDAGKKEWRPTLPNEGPALTAKLRVVHLWGTWCKPCAEEFPVLKQMDLQIRADYRGDVQFVYIADGFSTQEAMTKFMLDHHETMPLGLLFRDPAGNLSAELRAVLPQQPVASGRAEKPMERPINLPLTMLVDQNNVVRQAFVGSLLSRRADLVNGIAELYRSISVAGQAPPAPRQKVAIKPSRKRG